ncbi:hypothetical protein ABPG72_010109 [Tetrahymena utriculariae]
MISLGIFTDLKLPYSNSNSKMNLIKAENEELIPQNITKKLLKLIQIIFKHYFKEFQYFFNFEQGVLLQNKSIQMLFIFQKIVFIQQNIDVYLQNS